MLQGLDTNFAWAYVGKGETQKCVSTSWASTLVRKESPLGSSPLDPSDPKSFGASIYPMQYPLTHDTSWSHIFSGVDFEIWQSCVVIPALPLS